MKGKTGNLILVLREGEEITIDGPAKIKVKQIKRSKTVVLVDGNDETNITRDFKKQDVKD